MNLYIKYMVSLRCKMAVKAILIEMKLHVCSIDLGRAIIKETLSPEQTTELKSLLRQFGFLLLEDKTAQLIEKIKNLVIEKIHYPNYEKHTNFSRYISDQLNQDYKSLSTQFSDVTGTTIETFIIAHKIETVKELLLYDELNLTEISYKLDYSSVAHLSAQFKKVTGLTPTYFKKLGQYRKRVNIENI